MIIRLSTERPEAVEAGFAKVVGVQKKRIVDTMEEIMNSRLELPTVSPYGEGNASEKTVKTVKEEFGF